MAEQAVTMKVGQCSYQIAVLRTIMEKERLTKEQLKEMKGEPSKEILIKDLIQLRQRLSEMEKQEAETKRSHEELLSAKTAFEVLFEFSPEGIVVINREGLVVQLNKQAERMLGYTREECLGKPHEVLVPERFREQHRLHVKNYLADPRVRPMGIDLDLYIRRSDGREFPADIALGPMYIENGFVVLSVIRDITEVRKAETALREKEESLRKAMEDLARSNRELEQFAYVASHDLQEPLRMVSSYLQLLERRYKGRLDEAADEFISYAVDGATRMQRLINDLLDYSRVGTRGSPLAPTDAADALNEALANLRMTLEETHARVTHDELPVIMADRSQVVRLFQNLIGNAVKFRKRDVPPRVHVSAEEKGNERVFSVRDNGIGIEPEFFDRAFQIFRRLHTAGEYPGTGMGLAICKRIVERHGGRIWVESNPGEGSTFYFTLPAP